MVQRHSSGVENICCFVCVRLETRGRGGHRIYQVTAESSGGGGLKCRLYGIIRKPGKGKKGKFITINPTQYKSNIKYSNSVLTCRDKFNCRFTVFSLYSVLCRIYCSK